MKNKIDLYLSGGEISIKINCDFFNLLIFALWMLVCIHHACVLGSRKQGEGTNPLLLELLDRLQGQQLLSTPEPPFLPKIFCFCEIIPHEKEKEKITKSKKAAQREVIKVHGGKAHGPGGWRAVSNASWVQAAFPLLASMTSSSRLVLFLFSPWGLGLVTWKYSIAV